MVCDPSRLQTKPRGPPRRHLVGTETDPFGEILVESHVLGDDVVVALLTDGKLHVASGRQRYIPARRPELYGKLVELAPDGAKPVTKPGWKRTWDKQD